MRNALLYIFYCCDRTCAARLRIYREQNPDLLIYGICTPGVTKQDDFRRTASELDDLYFLPDYPAKWCWNNLDKVACVWYQNRGNQLNFDRIFVVDWDLLTLEPVASFSNQITHDSQISFVYKQEIADAASDHWTSQPEYEKFLSYIESAGLTHKVTTKAWLFAYVTSKQVFECIHADVINAEGYCEYRLPTIAHCKGIELSLLRRPQNWHELTNVNGVSIAKAVIANSQLKPQPFGIYHPVFEPYATKSLSMPLLAYVADGCMYRSFRRKIARLTQQVRNLVKKP